MHDRATFSRQTTILCPRRSASCLTRSLSLTAPGPCWTGVILTPPPRRDIRGRLAARTLSLYASAISPPFSEDRGQRREPLLPAAGRIHTRLTPREPSRNGPFVALDGMPLGPSLRRRVAPVREDGDPRVIPTPMRRLGQAGAARPGSCWKKKKRGQAETRVGCASSPAQVEPTEPASTTTSQPQPATQTLPRLSQL
jgi:hypothetical protein